MTKPRLQVSPGFRHRAASDPAVFDPRADAHYGEDMPTPSLRAMIKPARLRISAFEVVLTVIVGFASAAVIAAKFLGA